jgi:DNA-binding transcriptional MerR regulator
VQPARTPSGRRLYSDADIARLRSLKRATLAGRSIAQVASLSDEKLRDLVSSDSIAEQRRATLSPSIPGQANAEQFVERALAAVGRDGASELHNTLLAASEALGGRTAVERVLLPCITSMAESWTDSDLGLAAHHLSSALTRSVQEREISG